MPPRAIARRIGVDRNARGRDHHVGGKAEFGARHDGDFGMSRGRLTCDARSAVRRTPPSPQVVDDPLPRRLARRRARRALALVVARPVEYGLAAA
jgi:hypothetical protein